MSVVIRDYNHNTEILPFVKEAANNLYTKTKNKNYLNISAYKQPNVACENGCVLVYNSLSGKAPGEKILDKYFISIDEEANKLLLNSKIL